MNGKDEFLVDMLVDFGVIRLCDRCQRLMCVDEYLLDEDDRLKTDEIMDRLRSIQREMNLWKGWRFDRDVMESAEVICCDPCWRAMWIGKEEWPIDEPFDERAINRIQTGGFYL